mmetsp:Transcript_20425/g.40732  ORF Transcript_20425/g.40732 Transcript_20425/m.40732 type:complete len:340 (-) Transcript_20425:112-1131(-)
MMTEDALLRKEQISSYFERIQAKKDGDDQPKSGGFSVGSSTTTTTDVKTSHRPASTAAAATTTTNTGKISLFSSHIKFTSDVAPPPRTVELEKASTAAKCLAILGVTSSAGATTPALPTQEEITASRRLREQEIMKQYEDIKRVEEENRNRRPLVWDKPTFCPFGGETKSDDDEASASEESSGEDKSSESNKNKKRKEPSSSSSRVAEKCSNLLRKSSSSDSSIDPCSNLLRKPSSNPNRHNNLFPNFNMYGGMLSSASSVTVRTEWSKEEVDSFVEFTDKWILPGPKKKIKLDHTAEGSSSTASSSNTEGGGGEGEYTRRSSIGRPFLPQKVLPSDQA